MQFYFAYGSNLCREQMAFRCPESKPVAPFQLKGYTLVLRGVADVEPCAGCFVPGGIYSITSMDEDLLDRYEGFPTLYRKAHFRTELHGETHEVMFYELVRKDYKRPREGYVETIRRGYDHWGLSTDALETAIAQAAERGDELT